MRRATKSRIALRDELRSIVMHHVAGVFHHDGFDVAQHRATPLDLLDRCLRWVGDEAQNVRVLRADPQYGALDARPAGEHLVEAIERRVDDPVRRVPRHRPAAVGLLDRPVLRQKRGTLRRQPRIVPLQAARDVGRAFVITHGNAVAEFVEPLGEAPGGLRRVGFAQSEAFQVDDGTRAIRPYPGVKQSNVAAHAVADQDGRSGHLRIEHALEVRQIVGKPVTVGPRALGQAVTAPVRRHHAPVLRQGIDDELERRRNIHPAVQHDQRVTCLLRCRTPAAQVVAQAADVDELGARGPQVGVQEVFQRTREVVRCIVQRLRRL